MFTGLIEDMARIISVQPMVEDIKLAIIPVHLKAESMQCGDSIAVNGVCLTISKKDHDLLYFDISKESLNKTSLKGLDKGDYVNIERSVKANQRLGGHFVSGHVDCVIPLKAINQQGRSKELIYACPSGYEKFIASKGSVALDGVSLTVNEVDKQCFSVNIVPYSWENTTMQFYTEGQYVNMEVDLLARYVARLMNFRSF